MAVAQALLLALAEGRDLEAWEHAQALAKDILDDQKNVLAKGVLDGGVFAMRKAGELAEMLLREGASKGDGTAEVR